MSDQIEELNCHSNLTLNVAEQPVDLTQKISRYDVNIEKMPIFYLGSAKSRALIEKKISESKGGYVIYSQALNNGLNRQIKIDVSMSLGLPTAEDQDVIIGVFYFLYQQMLNEGGVCPSRIRIPGVQLIEIIRKKRCGGIYERIELSLKRISGLTVFQEQFIRSKDDDGNMTPYEGKIEEGIKILHFHKMYKLKKANLSMIYFDLEIPEWIRQDFESFYTNELNIENYFKFSAGRTRRLYRFLEIYRYQKSYFVDYNRLDSILSLNEHPTRRRRDEFIRRSLREMNEFKYLDGWEFQTKGVQVNFTELKRVYPKRAVTGPLSDLDRSFANEIITYLNDEKSRSNIEQIVSKFTQESIYIALSNTKAAILEEGVKKSKGAIFQHMINVYGRKKGL